MICRSCDPLVRRPILLVLLAIGASALTASSFAQQASSTQSAKVSSPVAAASQPTPTGESGVVTLMPLAPALIAAVVAVLGWYATYAYTQIREDRTRRLTTALEYRERQISEFYGPLSSLVEQIHNVWLVRRLILKAGQSQLSEDNRRKIVHYFWATHFNPLHRAIRDLLRTKLYLLDEHGRMPASFVAYFQHSVQEEVQQTLWDQFSIDTSFIEGTPYPPEFPRHVRTTLTRLLAEYDVDLAALEPGKRVTPTPPVSSPGT